MNIYWKAGIAVALLIVGFLGGCSWKQRELNQIKDAYAEQVSQALAENRELEKKMQTSVNDAAAQYQKQKAESDKTIENLKKDLANAKKNHPLPDACRLDADRMRIIKAAVSHANNPKP